MISFQISVKRVILPLNFILRCEMALDVLSSIHTTYALQIAQKTEENYHCAADYLPASLDQLFQANLTLNTLTMLAKDLP